MQKPVMITSDSSADLQPNIRKEFGLHVFPFFIQLEGKSGRDCVDIFPEEIYEAFRLRGSLPKTAAPSTEEMKLFFEQFTKEGYDVVHITLNHKFSSAYQVACIAAQEAQGDVYVVDSQNFCVGQGMLCVQGARLRDQGLPAAEIAALLTQQREKVQALYYLDGLDFVSKSGRCPAVVSAGAALLNLHPAVTINGATGDLVIGKKHRGKSVQASQAWLRDSARKFLENCDPSLCFFVRTPEIPPEVYEPMNQLAAELLPGVGRLVTDDVGCVIVSHVGGNCFGLIGMGK